MKILIPQGEEISAQGKSTSCTATDDTAATATSHQSSSDATSNVPPITTTSSSNGMYVTYVITYQSKNLTDILKKLKFVSNAHYVCDA